MSIIKKSKPSKDSSTAIIGFESCKRDIWLADGKCPTHRIDMSPDPAYGSGPAPAGFVQSGKFVESHGGKLGDISIYGQDKWAPRQRPFGLATRARRVRLRRQQPKQSNATTLRLASMHLTCLFPPLLPSIFVQ